MPRPPDPNVRYKRPAEVLDYDFDFGSWMPTGDSLPSNLAKSVVTADAGLTLGTKAHSGNIVKQWISGGQAGTAYRVICRAITTLDREKSLAVEIRVIAP